MGLQYRTQNAATSEPETPETHHLQYRLNKKWATISLQSKHLQKPQAQIQQDEPRADHSSKSNAVDIIDT